MSRGIINPYHFFFNAIDYRILFLKYITVKKGSYTSIQLAQVRIETQLTKQFVRNDPQNKCHRQGVISNGLNT